MPRPATTPWRTWLLGLAATLGSWSAWAQSVELVGLSAGRALLVVDGGQPRFASAGQTLGTVKVIAVGPDSAVVETDGQRRTLTLNGGPVSQAPRESARRITLLADSGGHFTAQGLINGQPVQYLVDTGATVMTLSETQATRIGLNYRGGQRVRVKTANGEIMGHQVTLDSVRVADHTTYGVTAVVLPADLPYILLGNSFLSRFRMMREDGRMTLEPRP